MSINKLTIVPVFFLFCACSLSKKEPESSDPALKKRLEEFVDLSNKMAYETRLDYTYPPYFNVISRDELLRQWKKLTDDGKFKLDTMKIDSLYPVFTVGNGRYAKIACTMQIAWTSDIFKDIHIGNRVNDTDSNTVHSIGTTKYPPEATLMLTLAGEKFGKENVSIDAAKGSLIMLQKAEILAVKDQYTKDWCFVDLEDAGSGARGLFSKEVFDKYDSYK